MMQATVTAEATMDYGSAVKQAARAAELSGHALVVLREDAGAPGMSEATERVANAVHALARVRNCTEVELIAVVAEANGILGEALQTARRVKRLTPRGEQALEAVRRSIILLNGVTRHHGMAVLPPPIPSNRQLSAPPEGVAERRKAPRAFLETEISFESADNFYTGFTEDISEGGLFLTTYDLRPIGTEIEIEFSLPTGHIVRTTGEVRWVRDPRDEAPDAPPGMGIQFRKLANEDSAAIQTFIEARAPLFFED